MMGWLHGAILVFLFGLTCAQITWYNCPIETDASEMLLSSSTSFFKQPSSSGTLNDYEKLIKRMEQIYKQQQSKENGFKKRQIFPQSAKCAYVSVPLDHENLPIGNIRVFAKCYYVSPTTSGQFWILQGGPGYSSSTIEGVMTQLAEDSALIEQYDICTMDHRGVDRSTELECVATQAQTSGSPDGCNFAFSELSPCQTGLTQGSFPQYYTSYQAASDLASLIKLVGKPNVAVYGVSYGTFWLSRFAQQYPTLANILIFDSIVSPYGKVISTFDQWDTNNNQVLLDYLTECSSDSYCSSKLTTDAISFANQTLSNIYGGNACSQMKQYFPTQESFSALMYGFAQSLISRPLIPAFIYRASRCSSDDLAVFQYYVSTYASSNTTCDTTYSPALYDNIVFAELFNPNLTLAQVQANANTLLFNGNVSETLFLERQLWSTYFDYNFYDQPVAPGANVEVLVLGSTLDPQTPIWATRNFKDTLVMSSSNLQYGEAVNGVHGTILMTSGGALCGYDIVSQFVKYPNMAIDMSCLSNIDTFDFDGTGSSDLNSMVYGMSNIYDGSLATSGLSGSAIIMIILGVFCFILLVAIIFLLVVYCKLKNKKGDRDFVLDSGYSHLKE